jgi:hypothetical protein
MQSTRTFDLRYAVLEDYLDTPTYPARLDAKETRLLADALADGEISPQTPMLVFEHQGISFSFPVATVINYNVIQGQVGDVPWMMTFCNACNTGMVFDPRVGNRVLHFQRRGAYEGLLLIWDEETGSYWQHIRGECLFGPSEGQQLGAIATTRHAFAAEIIERNPNARVLVHTLTEAQRDLSRMMEKMRTKPERLEDGIIASIPVEDTRRARFELGLGVWNGRASGFVPLATLHAHDNVYFTQFDGRRMLIYHAPEAIAPVAVYHEAEWATWEGDLLRLPGGASIQGDRLIDAGGRPAPLDVPMQLLMRWYGFALTFPGCKIFTA